MTPTRSFASLILGFVFIAATVASGCGVRYYDADRRDYHHWNRDEDRAYHEYWRERHEREAYRDYARLKAEQQRQYWAWRHDHPDAGRDRDRDDRNRDRDDRRDRR